MARPWIADQAAEIAVGLVVVAAGLALLWDAWDGRGQRAPWPLRALLPW